MEKQTCPLCGEKTVKHEIKKVPYTYKEHTFYINQPAEWCSACGEGIISAEDNKAVLADIQEEKDKIDELLPPGETKI